MRSDLFFSRGVMIFYSSYYIKAIQNWKKSYELKQLREDYENEDPSLNSQSSNLFDSLISELDDLEFKDLTYIVYEYQQNGDQFYFIQSNNANFENKLNNLRFG
ncbi:unnamed protein product [Paramecium sonneborni]|uniref:Uncharacterized protein n=1 Tax=Paramecium sonneborni TaxID=65129 RepID=A0A8S1RNZ8_9CILI|nr:unnamed protein product [Paramecium sonneborni]